MTTANVHVSRALNRKLSYIPESVVDYFEANGKVLTLNLGHRDAIAQYSGQYRYPVTTKDLNESLVEDLLRAGFLVNNTDQTLDRGDCKLYAADQEIHAAIRNEAEILWHQQHIGDHENQVAAMSEEVGRRTRGQARVGLDPRTGSVDSHVHHGGRR